MLFEAVDWHRTWTGGQLQLPYINAKKSFLWFKPQSVFLCFVTPFPGAWQDICNVQPFLE